MNDIVIKSLSSLKQREKETLSSLLSSRHLTLDQKVQWFVLIYYNGDLVACGGAFQNILKCLAVQKEYEGTGYMAKLLSALIKEQFRLGYYHLFIYTKSENYKKLAPFGFYPLVETQGLILLDNKKRSLESYYKPYIVNGESSGSICSLVMNCNPLTLGHCALVEYALKTNDFVYLFIVQEDQSIFPFEDRINLVYRQFSDKPGLKILPTGPYLISQGTFPNYFIKDQKEHFNLSCDLDIELFAQRIAPFFHITKRLVGSEPLCPVTSHYNKRLQVLLPHYNIEFEQMPRIEGASGPISASQVRQLIKESRLESFFEDLKDYLPPISIDYLCSAKAEPIINKLKEESR